MKTNLPVQSGRSNSIKCQRYDLKDNDNNPSCDEEENKPLKNVGCSVAGQNEISMQGEDVSC